MRQHDWMVRCLYVGWEILRVCCRLWKCHCILARHSGILTCNNSALSKTCFFFSRKNFTTASMLTFRYFFGIILVYLFGLVTSVLAGGINAVQLAGVANQAMTTLLGITQIHTSPNAAMATWTTREPTRFCCEESCRRCRNATCLHYGDCHTRGVSGPPPSPYLIITYLPADNVVNHELCVSTELAAPAHLEILVEPGTIKRAM